MTRTRGWWGAALVAGCLGGAAGCGTHGGGTTGGSHAGGGDGVATVTGTVGGASFQPGTPVAAFSYSAGSGSMPALLWIGISSTISNACTPACIEANGLYIAVPASTTAASVSLSSGSGPDAQAYVNSTCAEGGAGIIDFENEGGSVSLTSVTDQTVSGTFDITFGSGSYAPGGPKPPDGALVGGELTGSFDATPCP